VDFGEEQWLDIAQAIHTIEMIPKSMILILQVPNRFYLYELDEVYKKLKYTPFRTNKI
jgi:hypothetical protein